MHQRGTAEQPERARPVHTQAVSARSRAMIVRGHCRPDIPFPKTKIPLFLRDDLRCRRTHGLLLDDYLAIPCPDEARVILWLGKNCTRAAALRPSVQDDFDLSLPRSQIGGDPTSRHPAYNAAKPRRAHH